MRITHLEIKNVRAIDHVAIDFPESGVTIIEGDNEVGKSTIIDAFTACLTQTYTGRSQFVRSLQPVDKSDVSPEVTIGMKVGEYEFTLFKRWLKDKTASLKVHSPQVKNLSNKDAEHWVQEHVGSAVNSLPFDALTVRQGSGMDVFDAAQFSALEQALDSARGDGEDDSEWDSEAGAAGSGAGAESRRDGDASRSGLRAAIASEYTRYFTEKAGKPTKKYAQALEDEAQALARRDAAEATARQLEGDLHSHTSKSKKLAQYRAELPQLLEKKKETEATFSEVSTIRHKLEEAVAAKKLAEAKYQASEDRWASRKDLISGYQQREAELVTAVQDFEEADSQWQELKTQVDQAKGKLSIAKAAFQCEQLFSRAADLQLKFGERKSQISAWEATLSAADEAREIIADLDEKITDRRRCIDDSAWEEIRGCHSNWSALDAVRQQTASKITIAGPEMNETIVIDEEREITLGDHTITLIPGADGHKAREKADAQKRALDELLAVHGVSTFNEAQELRSQFVEFSSQRTDAQRNMDIALAGDDRSEIENKIAVAKRECGKFTEDYDSLLENLRASITEVDQATEQSGKADTDELSDILGQQWFSQGDTELPSAIDGEQLPQSVIDAHEAQLEELDKQVEEFAAQESKLGAKLTNSAAFEAKAYADSVRRERDAVKENLAAEREKISDEQLQADVELKKSEYEEAVVVEKRTRDDHQSLDPDGAERQRDLAANAVANTERDISHLQQEVSKLEGVLEAGALAIQESAEAKQHYEKAVRNRESIESRARASQRLFHIVEQCYAENQRAYVGPYLKSLSAKSSIVFGSNVSFETKDSSSMVIAERIKDGLNIDFEALSGGAKEQLGIVQRLAVADLVGEAGVPILLDDALGYADAQRIENMNVVLSDAGRRHQVIVFTCVPERYRQISSAQKIALG